MFYTSLHACMRSQTPRFLSIGRTAVTRGRVVGTDVLFSSRPRFTRRSRSPPAPASVPWADSKLAQINAALARLHLPPQKSHTPSLRSAWMSAVAGSKRKRLGEAKFYAVQVGRRPGIYTSWNECMEQIRGFKGAKCPYIPLYPGPPLPEGTACADCWFRELPTVKSFPTAEDAALYLTGKDPSLDPNSSSYTAKFYGVRSGKVPGVYTDWESAEKQVKGVAKPKVK